MTAAERSPAAPIATRALVAVALVAVLVHLGALADRFAMDDLPIIVYNPLLRSLSGLWRAFAGPYWPPEYGGWMYRPLPIATYVLDAPLRSAVWFHLVNLLWHAAAAVAVTLLAARLGDGRAGFIAGLLFAVHPVHVEAVANIVGRSEVMAALFVVLGVHAALVRKSAGWSAVCCALGLLSKENAAVLPGLVAWGWMLGFGAEGGRPSRRRMLTFVASWVAIAVAYAAVRLTVLQPYHGLRAMAPVFVGSSIGAIRLTGVAALTDVARLLCLPLHLQVDYSPAEYTLVTSLLDRRAISGVACVLVWAALVFVAWRRGRRLEAFGLGWVGIAFVPVSNLIFPVGFLIAERALYLPSVGLALAAGAWMARWGRAGRVPIAALVLLGAARSAWRVPAWRDNYTVTLSILQDSPRSYTGPRRMIDIYLDQHQPARALEAARAALQLFRDDPNTYARGAAAAFAAGAPAAADSLLDSMEVVCRHCVRFYREAAAAARAGGYPAAADSLVARTHEGP